MKIYKLENIFSKGYNYYTIFLWTGDIIEKGNNCKEINLKCEIKFFIQNFIFEKSDCKN